MKLCPLSRVIRVVLTLGLCLVYLGFVSQNAWAKKEDESLESDEESDAEGGTDSGDEDEQDDKDQPPVTAGGLFTMNSYPIRETSRPLSLTHGMTQLRLGLGTDLSAKGAFETFGLNLEAIYGYSDNFSLIGGITNAYNFKQFSFYFGFEGALVYDLVNVRVAANVHRTAVPEYKNFCTPAATGDPNDVLRPYTNPTTNQRYGAVSTFNDPARCSAPSAELINLPDGQHTAGDTQFSIDIGLPFRYSIRPEVAVVALQTLMSIDFNSINNDHVISTLLELPDYPMGPDRPPTQQTFMTTINTPTRNSAKPDLKPSIGITTNPIPQLNILVFAQLRIPDFDTQAGAFQVPVTGRLEASPNPKFDVGLEFTLLNVIPPSGQSPIDNRFLSLFMQARY